MASITTESVYKRIQSLLERIEHTEKSLSQGKSLSKEQQEVLSKKPYIELLLRQFRGHVLHSSNLDMQAVSLLLSQVCAGKGSMNENMNVEQVGKGRYLCVSDGFSICCLDLKQRRMCGGRHEFVHPKTSNLKLLEEGFPLSMGLFKVTEAGAAVYLVTEAGQVLCFQRTRIILRGFDVADLEEKRRCCNVDGIVASSDGEQGTTMCSSIIQGCEYKSLFITTFTWEAVDGAFSLASNLQALRRDGCRFDDWPVPREVDFLRVVVKGYYVAPSSATGLMPRCLLFKIPTRLSACFL